VQEVTKSKKVYSNRKRKDKENVPPYYQSSLLPL
jgi:hypothetical protein